MPDHDRIKRIHEKKAEAREETLAEMQADLIVAADDLFYSHTPDARNLLNDILVLAGVKEGDLKTVRRNSDVPTGTTEPIALRGGYIAAYEHDGTPLGTGFKSEDEARTAGFEAWLDAEGKLMGWRKPAPAALTTGSPADREVPVKNKKGEILRQIKVIDGNADKNLEAMLGTDGSVEYFLVKPRIIRR